MNTLTIGSILRVPRQDESAAGRDITRTGLARWRGGRGPHQPAPHSPAASCALHIEGGVELLLNLAVRPAHAAAPQDSRAHGRMLHGTMALLSSMAQAAADPAIARACDVLHEHAVLHDLAVGYRTALQAG